MSNWIRTALGVSTFVLAAAGCKGMRTEKPSESPTTVASVPSTQPDESAMERTAELLEKKVPLAELTNQPLEAAIRTVADQTGVTIAVDWVELERVGVGRHAQVSTRLRNVKGSKVLKTVLESVSAAVKRPADLPTYHVTSDGEVWVTTPRRLLATTASTRRYPLDDLIVRPQLTQAGDPSATTNELKGQIQGLITDTIAVDQWANSADAKPGDEGLGTIGFDGNTMVVTHTADVQREITRLLAKLREQAVPQAR